MGHGGFSTRRPRRMVTLLGCLLAVAAIGYTASSGASGATSAKSKLVLTTTVTKAVKKAKWASNVTLKAAKKEIKISSNGLPSSEYWTLPKEYAVPDEGVNVPNEKEAHLAKDPTAESPISIEIPEKPQFSTSTTPTKGGPIGIMLSGAVLFDPYEGDGITVALASNFSLTNEHGEKVYFIDGCNGHPSPMREYHYHGLPTCITEKVDGATGPSHMIGVALDGFPIYGDRNIEGKLVKNSELDECNGIDSPTPEFPKGIYHYVLKDEAESGEVRPEERSSLRCYHGKMASDLLAFTSALLYRCAGVSGEKLSADPIKGTREEHAYSSLAGARTLYTLPTRAAGER